jgi:molybdopterin converting factor subunit 1
LIRVLLFGPLREKLGASITVDAEGPLHVRELLDRLCTHPTVAGMRRHLRVACNQEFVTETDVVQPTDELALIPPVAGG